MIAIHEMLMEKYFGFLGLLWLCFRSSLQFYTFFETSLVTMALLPHFIAFFSDGEIPGTPGTLATTFLAFGKCCFDWSSDQVNFCDYVQMYDYVILSQFWIWHLHWASWGFWSCTYLWFQLIPLPLRYCDFPSYWSSISCHNSWVFLVFFIIFIILVPCHNTGIHAENH